MRLTKFILVLFIAIALLSKTKNALAWFDEMDHSIFNDDLYKLLKSDSLDVRYKTINAFLSHPKVGINVLRNNFNKSGKNDWQLIMLLGFIGEYKDLKDIYAFYRSNNITNYKKIYIGTIERLYFKYRLGNISNLNFKDFKITKIENIEKNKEYNKIYTNLKILVENKSNNSIIIEPSFNFWIGKPEIYPEIKLLWIQKKTNKVFNYPLNIKVPSERYKIRIDLRLKELGASENIIHRTAFLKL